VLPYDDPRWRELKGGYKTPYNPIASLKNLESNGGSEDVWDELWQELHHQGDVGEASYAAVPHLIRIQKERGDLGWNVYAFLSTIEIERHRKSNPPIPPWLESSYNQAWQDLLKVALRHIQTADDPLLVRSLLGAISISKGLVKLGAVISYFNESELLELLDEQMAWSELYR